MGLLIANNISIFRIKNANNLPCLCRLEIDDIYYYLGDKMYIVYNNLYYTSIIELL